ncbi:phage tail tape measure protein [Deinococcus sp.]|uniref:phage tail tape measure protein n=1 Tax=Deinococcus sp. TaxID=47478 RepID=UPI0025C0DB37|nr:phage tail tape measure protein [Deinococcus sp.]
MTGPALPPLTGSASLDVTAFRKGARDALNALREVVDYAKKQGTLTLTAKLSGASTAAIRKTITDAMGTDTLTVKLTFNPASVATAVRDLRTALSAVVGINVSALTALQAQINTQITQLTALIAQLRAAGGGSGGSGSRGSSFSAGTQALLTDLERLNNEYKRGDVNATAYAARLTGIQASLRTAAAAATAGSAEFRALDTALTRTVQGLRNVNSDGITKLRTELAGARAQFDAAAAAATTLAQRRAAVAAYEADLNRIRVSLTGMAAAGNLTAEQLGTVNRLLAQTAREGNTLRGGINIAGLSGNISNALQQLAGFVPGLSQVTGLFGALPAPILATVAALGAFTVAMGASFRTAAQFQQGMADIKALTQPTAQGLLDLREAALNIGEPLGVGAVAASRGILELNRAGLSAQDVIGGGLVGALNLAGAAGIEVATAAKLGAAAMTAFKLSSADLPRIADNFANFSNSTFLGAEDLSQAIASVGPVAVGAGLSIEQFGGIMATAAQGGFKNMSDAGTSLKTMLLSLQSPTETGAAALERIGVNAYDAEGNFRPFLSTVDDLRAALKGMSEQGRNKVLKDVFGQDAIRIATILVGQNTDAINKNIATQGKLGEAARVAKERLDTYQGKVARLIAVFERLKITLGEKLLPAATGLIKGLSGGVGMLERFANGSENMLGYVLPLVTAFIALRGAVIAAAAPAIWASLMAAVTTFFTTVSTWVARNPFGLIATAVAALAVMVNEIMGDTAAIYDQVDKANQDSFDSTMKRVKALTDEGTELSRTQAKMLLAQQSLQAAEQGTVTGVTLFGERTYSVDPQEVEAARKRLEGLRLELAALRSEAGRRGTLTTTQVTNVDPAKVKEQSAAVRELRKTLDDRAFQLKIGGLDGVEKEVAQVGKAFDELRKKLKTSFGGNLNSNELKGALAELAEAQAKEERAVRAKYAKEQADERRKEYQQAAAQARQGAFDVQRAEIQAMQEGRAKTQAERDLQLAELRDGVARQVAEYAKYPDLKAQVESGGRRQEVALRRQWQQEDLATARSNAEAVAAAEGEARAAIIAAMPEGAARRQAEREAELAGVRKGVADRLAALAGYPAAQARIEQAGQQQLAALRQGWARQDEADARERAKRIVAAFQAAQDAQLAAQGAARDAQAAQLDLGVARRVAQAGRNAQEVARIELQAVRDRAALAERATRAEAQAQRETLARTTNERLTAEGVTAAEQAQIRREYYARVAELDSTFTADQIGRTQDREQAERDGLERIRAAQVAAAQQPVTAAQADLKGLENQKALATTAAERLGIEQRIVAAQDRLRAAYQGILDRTAQLRLTDEERRTLADGVTEATQGQAQATREVVTVQQELVDQSRALLESRLALVDAEGELALRMARTDAQAAAAQQRLLSNAQGRLTGLDTQISGETDETKRNALLQQRLTLTGQIADLQDRITAAPLDGERRRVTLYQAQAELLLQAAGLSDDRVAGAQLAVRTAQQEVALAQRALDLARTEAGQDEARTTLTQKQTALLAAQAQAVQARNEWDAQALDVAEARLRAEARITGMSEDAVAAAQLDLDLTRQRLAATRQAQAAPDQTGTRRAELAKQELELTAQQAEQERKLTAVQRDRRTLADSLTVSQGALTRALTGGTAEAQKTAQIQADLLTTRRALTTAEREYNSAASSGDPTRQKAATDALTQAITAQRGAVRALADGYAGMLTNMDNVREAAARLNTAAYGEQGRALSAATTQRELARLQAIETRRNAAREQLAEALGGSDADLIARAANEFATQEERYRKQADALDKAGAKFTRTGQKEAQGLADQVDALGIQYDRESVIVQERIRAANKEAEAARLFSDAVDRFSKSAVARAPAPVTYSYQGKSFESMAAVNSYADQERREQNRQTLAQAAAALKSAQVSASSARVYNASGELIYDAAQVFDAGGQALIKTLKTTLPEAARSASPAPATVPAPNHTTNWDVEVTVNGAGLNPDQVADRVIGKLEDRARRSGRNC